MRIRVICIAGLVFSMALAANGADPGPGPGAEARHWAFEPITDPAPPRVARTSWVRSPIDTFIAAELEQRGLSASSQADKRTLIRRATFDLTGLPPTPQEIEAFLADESSDAFARVVERLLASPEYGRKWGRHWLDLARYADTAGDTSDYPIPEAYLYRDYVVDAFNEDLPYDQFLREQLAGDILAWQSPDERFEQRLIATGFIALSRQYGPQLRGARHLIIENTIGTLGETMLGLTIGCARCHDHKDDPIPTEDYYALYGIFQSTVYPHAGGEESPQPGGLIPLTRDPQLYQSFIAYSELRAELGNKLLLAKRGRDKEKTLDEYHQQFRQTLLTRPAVERAAFAVREADEPSDAQVQLYGEPQRPGESVPRGFVSVIARNPRPPIPSGSGRLELADWIASPDNPLTARVMANRIWLYHFGRGVVPTPNNFGLSGQPPTHSQLLDYLASRFIESGWSIKAMHRLIMNSATYQMASLPVDANLSRDGLNQWYWRFERRRLTGEEVRDAMMSVSGTLDHTTPGPHPFVPSEQWNAHKVHYTQHRPFHAVYESNHRSIYLMTQRLHEHPLLGLFDPPDRSTSTPQRRESVVPLQSLFMMNSPFVERQAEALAQRILAHAPDDPQRLRHAHERVWGRALTQDELAESLEVLAALAEGYASRSTPGDDGDPHSQAWKSYARTLLTSNPFIFVD